MDDSVIRIDAAIVGLNSSRVDYLDCSETPACCLAAEKNEEWGPESTGTVFGCRSKGDVAGPRRDYKMMFVSLAHEGQVAVL